MQTLLKSSWSRAQNIAPLRPKRFMKHAWKTTLARWNMYTIFPKAIRWEWHQSAAILWRNKSTQSYLLSKCANKYSPYQADCDSIIYIVNIYCFYNYLWENRNKHTIILLTPQYSGKYIFKVRYHMAYIFICNVFKNNLTR